MLSLAYAEFSTGKSVMLYGSETCLGKDQGVIKLENNDVRVIRWMNNVRLEGRFSAVELRSILKLNSMHEEMFIK